VSLLGFQLLSSPALKLTQWTFWSVVVRGTAFLQALTCSHVLLHVSSEPLSVSQGFRS
jgi:hypothetical protein